jgi:hypothetical protein
MGDENVDFAWQGQLLANISFDLNIWGDYRYLYDFKHLFLNKLILHKRLQKEVYILYIVLQSKRISMKAS